MMNNSNLAYACCQGPRDGIEDDFGVLEINLPVVDQNYKLIWVCDGVGGYQGGEVCSNETGRCFSEAALKAILSQNKPNHYTAILRSACQIANREILKLQRTKPEFIRMSTTIVAALIVDDMLNVIWAGDSRCYHCTDYGFVQLTCDHSVVQKLIDAGELQPEYASLHPAAHTITEYIGKEDLRLETTQAALSFGDIILLTSDGATDVLSDNDFIHYIEGYREGQFSFNQLPHLLAKEALDRGTTDNTTIIAYEHLSLDKCDIVFPDFTLTGTYAQELANNLILIGKDDLS